MPMLAAEPEIKPEDLPRVPPTPAEKAVETFTLRPGFRAELMVAEPLVVSPVALAFDEDSKLYVVEMIDYSERQTEKLSRIKLLEDVDGDGRYEKATVFAEGLSWATSVTCWDGGVFVLASQELTYFKDTDGDGKADVHALVASGFGAGLEKLNVQALPNCLQWGPDQRIHGALGGNASKLKNFARVKDPVLELRGRDFSFDPHDLKLRAELGGGQWGMSFDDAGRKFVTSNSRHLVQIMYDAAVLNEPGRAEILPPAAVDIPIDGPQAEVFRTSPVEPWRVLRTQWRVSGAVKGIVEGGGRASGYFTGAAGGMIYRGDAYPAEFYGNAFVADCGSNLIHRKVLTGEVQLTAKRAADEQKSEFFASRDNWCRPVFITNAPDGCLWFCDMQRETIEHPWSLPPNLKKHLDLNSGNDRGRLWRIVPTGGVGRKISKLGGLPTSTLVGLLGHANGWHRDTAARLLHQRRDPQATALLRAMVEKSPVALGRLTALRVMSGSGVLDDATILRALKDTNALVRAEAWRCAARQFENKEAPNELFETIGNARESSDWARYQCLWIFCRPNFPSQLAYLAPVLLSAEDPWVRAAALAASAKRASDLFLAFEGGDDAKAVNASVELARLVGMRNREEEIKTVLRSLPKLAQPDKVLTALSEGVVRKGGSLAKTAAAEFLRPRIDSIEEQVRTGKTTNPGDLALLAAAGFPTSAAAITTGLESGLKTDLVTAAVEALQRLNPADLGAIFTRVWPKLPAETRATAVRLWRSRPKHVESLLAAVESGAVAKDALAADDVAALRERKEPALRERVTKLFGPPPSREKVFADFQPALTLKGDAAKGRATFAARCTICHRIGEEGHPVGPDLAAAAVAGREKLLGNILDPSREITAGFATTTVETKSGEVLMGVTVADNDGTLTLRLAGGPLRTFARLTIARVEHTQRSMMPEGLEAGMSSQDMADLLEFLAGK
jgi:putative membrane-bound dehydrogenase-like protein